MEDFKDFDEFVRDELAPELTVLRPLGRGSVASVYLAHDPALDRQVAVKVILPKYGADETARRRFEREARAVARIRHPNVTAILGLGRLSDGLPYFTMDYVDGRNLEDTLAATEQMPLDEAKEILRQLAAGLAAAHAQQIVHRDVKPANVLRETATGRVVLTDFGLAAAKDRTDETTRLTMFRRRLDERVRRGSAGRGRTSDLVLRGESAGTGRPRDHLSATHPGPRFTRRLAAVARTRGGVRGRRGEPAGTRATRPLRPGRLRRHAPAGAGLLRHVLPSVLTRGGPLAVSRASRP